MSLLPCPSCARHVRATEAVCPFCASALDPSIARSPARSAGRLHHVAAIALVGGIAVAGCQEETSDERFNAPLYGMPSPCQTCSKEGEPQEPDAGDDDAGVEDGGVEEAGDAS